MTGTSDITLVDLYLRKSDGRDLSSLPAREKILRRAADVRGWQVHDVLIENDLTTGKGRNASAFKRRKIILPNGKTALRVVRPGFRTILSNLAEGRSQAVLAEDLDRVVRDPRDGEDLLEIVEETKATADSISGSLKLTKGGTDKEIFDFRNAVNAANKASKDTSRRVKNAHDIMAYTNLWFGGPRPYGWTPVPHPADNRQNTELVINEDEAAEIERAANAVLSEPPVPLRSIARGMNDRGVPTATGKGKWTGKQVADMLRRPRNGGVVILRGEEVGRYEGDPILPEDVWRAVVDKLTDEERSANQRGRAPRWLGTNLYHDVCGSAVAIAGGKGRAPSYVCAHDDNSKGNVHARRNAVAIDRYVARTVIEMAADRDRLVVETTDPDIDVDALRTERTALRVRKQEFIDDRADGLMSRADMLKGIERVEKKVAEIEDRLSKATKVSPVSRLVSPFDVEAHDLSTAAKWVKLTLGEQRAIIGELVTVTILPDDGTLAPSTVAARKQLSETIRNLWAAAGEPSFHSLGKATDMTYSRVRGIIACGRTANEWPPLASLITLLNGDSEAIRPLWETATTTFNEATVRIERKA